MSRVIPREIDEEEILIRFIHANICKKNGKIKEGDVFLPYKGGVSLQRKSYCTDQFSKSKALEIKLEYKGITVFKKKNFNEALIEHKECREDFEACLMGTPMKDDHSYYQEQHEVLEDSEGNPAHADIKYINPATDEIKKETPNVALRIFSKILFRLSKLIKDTSSDNTRFSQNIDDIYS